MNENNQKDRLNREMSISHVDFMRLIPGATEKGLGVENAHVNIDGLTITLGRADKCVVISLSEETERRLGGFRLPVTHVEFSFKGLNEAEINKFLDAFDRTFHRGGG
ncbi:MAG: hypothetical protein HOO00_02735 [Rhodospirillaceae bacterium]|jgi:hypothetical protein|nr:hypothetical protein [Rhodospirillaceae bacterium]MBT5658905.1 hypothetical protein [Rhodospirillaceae bacterium]MBT5751506.1 hypothetical protein [Rhodospirillaceae bacterium]